MYSSGIRPRSGLKPEKRRDLAFALTGQQRIRFGNDEAESTSAEALLMQAAALDRRLAGGYGALDNAKATNHSRTEQRITITWRRSIRTAGRWAASANPTPSHAAAWTTAGANSSRWPLKAARTAWWNCWSG